MDQTTEARKYGSPKGWNDLFPSCPGIAKKLLMYLDLETAVACRKVYPEWEAVIDSCKVIQERFSKSSLFQAAKDGHVYTAELLISKGADVDSTEGGGATDQPLKIAAENGHVGMVELLIGKGADVNISDPLGDTTLTVSSKKGHFNVVERLLANGGDVNRANRYGETPLMLAAMYSYIDVVQLLISKGADVRAEASHGETALSLAAMQHIPRRATGYYEVAKYLLTKGAEVNHKDYQGRTALCYAAKAKQEGLIELLLENDAKICKIEHESAEFLPGCATS